ncbi:Uncharacterized protein APZ42_025379 [Daphnia magna]|uniref:RNA-directed DNA polymerase n=1 Tax=Daphnia magna TaxID=35525 RepID=A0A164T570_9CRUS|nr:Uncharacterized protein APZ42_025379 [Daphnia magna]
MQDGHEHPIAYSSRPLTKAESKYGTTEKEALAVIDAIKHFRHYRLDKPFEIISDHRPLQWLKHQKDNNGRLGRWVILLAVTNYELKCRPGIIHQNADCLSRLKIASIQLASTNIKFICEKQMEDDLCVAIKNYLETDELEERFCHSKPDWVKEIENFEILEGTLYRHELPSKNSKRNELNHQLVLPLSLRLLVLKELHNAPMGRHLAFYKTYLKVKNHYYWPTYQYAANLHNIYCFSLQLSTHSQHPAQPRLCNMKLSLIFKTYNSTAYKIVRDLESLNQRLMHASLLKVILGHVELTLRPRLLKPDADASLEGSLALNWLSQSLRHEEEIPDESFEKIQENYEGPDLTTNVLDGPSRVNNEEFETINQAVQSTVALAQQR